MGQPPTSPPRPPGGLGEGEQRILASVGDPVALAILAALARGPKDVHRLVVETGLPQSSAYRKLSELREAGLVATDRLAFTAEKRKVELFRSRVRGIRVSWDSGRVRLEVATSGGVADRLGDMWEDVRRFRE